jgi:hypothetical protein
VLDDDLGAIGPRLVAVGPGDVRTLVATPRLRWNSSKRVRPWKASRTMSSVQRSPMISSARAIEQLWES